MTDHPVLLPGRPKAADPAGRFQMWTFSCMYGVVSWPDQPAGRGHWRVLVESFTEDRMGWMFFLTCSLQSD